LACSDCADLLKVSSHSFGEDNEAQKNHMILRKNALFEVDKKNFQIEVFEVPIEGGWHVRVNS